MTEGSISFADAEGDRYPRQRQNAIAVFDINVGQE
jgi:hypothetical protein